MPLPRFRTRTTVRSAARLSQLIEPLESRQLLTVVPVAGFTPGNLTGETGTTQTVDLTRFADDNAVTSHTVRMTFPTGTVDIQTFDTEVPLNVANFLLYTRGGPAGDGYEGTYFHRFLNNFVAQGGSFYPEGASQSSLGTPVDETGQPVVTDEVAEGAPRNNTRGTVAFARLPAFDDLNQNGVQDPGEPNIPGGGPNSAGSGFFFNLADNSSNLDFQNGGFDVFGEVIAGTGPSGQPVGDPIAGVIVPLGQVPSTQRLISDAVVLAPTITFTAISSNPSAVTVTNPTNSEGKLQLQFVGAAGSSSDITVTATQPGQATPVTLTFTATVGGTPAPEQLAVTLGAPGGPTSVTFNDADGTAGSVSVRGGGTAVVTLAGAGLTQATQRTRATVSGAPTGIASIAISGGSAATTVTIAGRGGTTTGVDLAGFTADSALRSIAAKAASLSGALNVTGAVGKVDLGAVTNTSVTVGGSTSDRPGTINVGTATGASFTSTAFLRSITAGSFVGGTSIGTITAPAVDRIASKGDFSQIVNVTSGIRNLTIARNLVNSDIVADVIGSVSVRGAMTNAGIAVIRTFNANELPLGRVSVAGPVTGNSLIRANGNIGTVSLGATDDVVIFTGVSGQLNGSTLPSQPADFIAPAAIRSVTIRGTNANTNIAAPFLGRVNLGTLTLSNNGTPFGVAADEIASLSGSTSAGGPRLTIRNIDLQTEVDQQVGSADLGDFQIIIQ